MITIVLAEDHRIVRHGLKVILAADPEFNVIGEASNGAEALELVERLKPDILVLDIMMPVMNGLEVAAHLATSPSSTAIVILSMQNNEAYIHEALRFGARAYILKDNSTDELHNAIIEAKAGRYYLGSSLNEQAIQAFKEKTGIFASDPIEKLTPRERQILDLAIRGFTNSEIALRLAVSQRTVETHCTNLMHKINVANRNQLVQFAIKHGLVSAQDILSSRAVQLPGSNGSAPMNGLLSRSAEIT